MNYSGEGEGEKDKGDLHLSNLLQRQINNQN